MAKTKLSLKKLRKNESFKMAWVAVVGVLAIVGAATLATVIS